MPKKKPVTIDGVEYATLDEAAEAYNTTSARTLMRMKKYHMSLEQALKMPKRAAGKPAKKTTVGEEIYESVAAACRANGTNQSTAQGNIGKGVPVNEAVMGKNRYTFSFHGENYKSKRDCILSLGLPYHKVRYYKKVNNCSDKEAIEALLKRYGVSSEKRENDKDGRKNSETG